jgi:MFS family permease
VSIFCTIVLGLLFFSGQLEPWHVYVSSAIASVNNVFRWPAFTAMTPLLVPEKHLGRTGGMIQFAESSTLLISPALGGLLYVTVTMSGVLLIDCATFLFSLAILLLARLPRAERRTHTARPPGSLWSEAWEGWRYITSQSGLTALLLFMAFIRFVLATVNVLAVPLVLNFTSVEGVGVLRSIGGFGALIGSILMSLWSGSRRRVYVLLIAETVGGLCILLAGFSYSVIIFGVLVFVYFFRYPISLASSYAIWLKKVPPELKGRVFSIVRLGAFIALPLSYLVAGPLVDRFFEPLFAAGGPLAGSAIGRTIGIGPGRGVACVFIIMGALGLLIAAAGWMSPRLRGVDDEPDSALSQTLVQGEPQYDVTA